VAGLAAALRWLAEDVGWELIHRRTALLAARARHRLAGIPGVRVITPDAHAGLVSFTVEGRRPEDVLAALLERGMVLRTIPSPACVRLSAGFFQRDEDLDRLVEGVAEVAAGS
jgi:selenocysteine lyase/cysteine desulfurase